MTNSFSFKKAGISSDHYRFNPINPLPTSYAPSTNYTQQLYHHQNETSLIDLEEYSQIPQQQSLFPITVPLLGTSSLVRLLKLYIY